MVFKFRDGGEIRNGVSAEAAWNEMSRVAEENEGEVRPDQLVEVSRPKGAVLHPLFEWDNQKAADAHRVWQARQLIRSVVVVSDDDSTETINCMVNVKVDEGRAYKSASEIATNKDEVESARQYLLSKQEGALRAFEDFERIVKQSRARRIHRSVKAAGIAVRGAVEAVRAVATA